MSQRINCNGPTRLTDALSFRTRIEQRIALEKFAEERKIGICEAARMLLDAGIEAKGITA